MTVEDVTNDLTPTEATPSDLSAHQRIAVAQALLSAMGDEARSRFAEASRPLLPLLLWEEEPVRVDLKALARLCDGWWAWDGEPTFVTLEAWEERVRAFSGEEGADPSAGNVVEEALAGTDL